MFLFFITGRILTIQDDRVIWDYVMKVHASLHPELQK